MTILLTGAGSWGVRTGDVLGLASDLMALMGGTATTKIASGTRFPARFTTINTDLAAGTALPVTQANAQNNPYSNLSQWQGAQASLFSWASNLVIGILKGMVNLDQGLPEGATISTQAALNYLLNQMYGGSLSAPTATIQQCTLSIGAQTAVNTPIGNPVIVLGTKTVQGLTLQLVFPETITFTTTRDSQGGATSGNETISYAGFPAAPSVWSQLYPASGSGCSGSLACVDGSKSLGSTGNLLNNSDFAVTTTANVADNWTNVTGAAGTDILAGTGTGHVYTTLGGSIGFVGDAGGTALKQKISQSFKTPPTPAAGAGGTSSILAADTQYAYNFWAISPSGIPAAAVVRISLQDGAGNILNDDLGTANSTSYDFNALSLGNAWANFNGSFRTPANMTPQTTPFKLVFEVTTAISTGKTIYFGRMALANMTPLYVGGPPAVIFSGNVPTIDGLVSDSWTIAPTNTYGKFSLYLDKIFNLRANGVTIPYSGSPTVADSLITD